MTNNLTCSVQEFIAANYTAIIVIASIILIIVGYLAFKHVSKKHKIKEANMFSCMGSFVIFLTFAALYYAVQKNSDMVTATVTTILVIITGYYAWNTHLQVESMSDQARLIGVQIAEMHKQTETMEKQFTLTDKNIKRDRIIKELDLLILPLKAIYRRIESKGINTEWWDLYTTQRGATQHPVDRAKFESEVDIVDQNKYLATRDLYSLIERFIIQLRDMKRNNDDQHQELLKKATEDLYYREKANGGYVEARFEELTTELQALDNKEGKNEEDLDRQKNS